MLAMGSKDCKGGLHLGNVSLIRQRERLNFIDCQAFGFRIPESQIVRVTFPRCIRSQPIADVSFLERSIQQVLSADQA